LQKGGVMREVIERLLQAESCARQRLEGARAEAEQILLAARQQAEKTVVEAVEAARVQAGAMVTAAVAQAEGERAELLRAAAKRCDDECRISDELRQELVAGIVRCICMSS
jgi:vacuolar-type H+-ATPase subunit H